MRLKRAFVGTVIAFMMLVLVSPAMSQWWSFGGGTGTQTIPPAPGICAGQATLSSGGVTLTRQCLNPNMVCACSAPHACYAPSPVAAGSVGLTGTGSDVCSCVCANAQVTPTATATATPTPTPTPTSTSTPTATPT